MPSPSLCVLARDDDLGGAYELAVREAQAVAFDPDDVLWGLSGVGDDADGFVEGGIEGLTDIGEDLDVFLL